jgi:hypothetical protein
MEKGERKILTRTSKRERERASKQQQRESPNDSITVQGYFYRLLLTRRVALIFISSSMRAAAAL